MEAPPMSRKRVTVQSILRVWGALVLIYLVRTWSENRQFSIPREIWLYGVAFILGVAIDTFIWPTRIEMGREESDLVQEYIKFKKDGETMGQYLERVEKEEEESIEHHEKLIFKKNGKQGKKQRPKA